MTTPIKCVSWNVNSARARLERIKDFLAAHRPDVLCLQELKCTEAKFPLADVRALGYEAALFGQPTYNGVAILSKRRAAAVDTGLDDQARVIAGTVLGVRWVNVYVPNGQRVGSEKYRYKLAWLDKLENFLVAQKARYGEFVLMGDFNTIFDVLDAAHPAAWEGTVLHDPATRAKMEGICRRLRLEDAVRRHAPGPGLYTWWDYRNRGFQVNDGLRIDHIFMTPALAARSVNAWVDVAERGAERPSDHAPLLARLIPDG